MIDEVGKRERERHDMNQGLVHSHHREETAADITIKSKTWGY